MQENSLLMKVFGEFTRTKVPKGVIKTELYVAFHNGSSIRSIDNKKAGNLIYTLGI